MSVNQVFINGEEILSTRGNTVTENTLVQGETAQDKTGKTIEGNLDPVTEEELDEVKEQLNELSDDVYKVSDEEGEIEETDYIPFNDISDVNKPKKKALLSSIIDKIKSAFLPKTWGHVELIQSSDVLAIKDKEVDATASDNNITANHYPSSNKILDNNGKTITSFESIVQTDGTIKAKMYSRNYDTDGNFLGENYITVNKEKSGNSSYGVADKRAFRKAIETIDQMGTKIPANSDLDDYTTAGTYYVENNSDAGTISNMPFGVAYSGKLIVLDMDSNVRVDQIYITNFQTNSLVYMYIRQIGNDGVARPWREITAPHTYELGMAIPADSDLNSYKTEGVYYVQLDSTASTISNVPIIRVGKLIVARTTSANTYLIQTYYANASTVIYVRWYNPNGDSWSEWKQFATTDDITPANVGNGYAEATVSGSAITATITGFKLRAGVIVAIRIVPEITSACTLNINNTGAKSVKFWSNEDVSFGKPIGGARITTFIYDGTYYRVISIDKTPHVGNQSYVADTSGNILIDWGYGSNRAQLKYNVGSNKLLWNYYKNSAWRGDVELLDSLHGILATENLTNIASLDDIPVNTIGKIEFTSASGLSPLESSSIRAFFYTCFTPTSYCKVLTLTRYSPTFTDSSSKWERVNNGSGWTPYWVDYTPRGTYVGTCTTAGATKDKVATVEDSFKLTKGVRVAIKFSNSNTYSNVTSSPITLNVNGTGAKNIWYNNTHSGAGNTGTNTTAYGVASRYVYYVYDGTYWVWDGCGVDNNTTYSAMSASELTTGTATTQRTVRADYLKSGIETLITNKTDTSLNTSSKNPIANSVVASSFQTLTNQTTANTNNLSIVRSQICDDSDKYSSQTPYSKGDFCIHDNKVYKCITDCSAAAWGVNASCFTESTILRAIRTDHKFIFLSKTVTVASDTSVWGGYYGYVNMKDEINAAIGSGSFECCIPLSATKTDANGVHGLLGIYNSQFLNDKQFSLNAGKAGTYRCDFLVIFK